MDSLLMWVLYFNNEPVSHCFGLDAGDHRYIIANSYAERAAKHSTGTILVRYMIQDAIDRGLTTINYGQGDSGYKTRWGAKPARQLVDWLALRPGTVGWALSRLSRFWGN